MDPNKNIKTACLILLPIILALGYAYFKKQKVQSDYFLIDIKQLEFFSKQICTQASSYQQQENLLILINTIESQKGEFKNQLKTDSITLIENLKTLYRSYQSQTSTAIYIQQLEQRLQDCPAKIYDLQILIKRSSSWKEEDIKAIQEKIKNKINELNKFLQEKNHNQATIQVLKAEIERLQKKMANQGSQISQRSPTLVDIMNIEDKLKKLNDEKLLISADIFKLNKTLDIELKNQSMSLSLQISIISSLDDSYKKIYQDINTFNLDMTKTFYQFQQENLLLLEQRTANLENLKLREQQENKLADIKRLLLEVQLIRQNFQEYFENFNIRYFEVFSERAHNQTLQSIKDKMSEAIRQKEQWENSLKNIRIEIESYNSKRNKLRIDIEAISKNIIAQEIILQNLKNQLQVSAPTPVDEQPTIDQHKLKIFDLERLIDDLELKISQKQQEISYENTLLNQIEQSVRNIQSELKLLDQQLTQKIIDCLRARKKHKELSEKLSQSNMNRNQMKDNIKRIIQQLKQNIDSKINNRGYPTEP